MTEVMLRVDLAVDGYSVPAYDYVTAPDNGHGGTYLNARELEGAIALGCDLDDDTKPEYNFERIKLLDGRVFFMHGIDLDYLDGES